MKYRKKPVIVEAEQFHPDKKPWPRGVSPSRTVPDDWNSPELNEYCITTSYNFVEGTTRATRVYPGDWIVQPGVSPENISAWGSETQFPIVVKPNIFESTYEPVEEETNETSIS